jgi:hypothetical protein
MSSMIFVFAPTSLAWVIPEALVAGVGERLALLTYLYCPESEERPDDVCKRLRVTMQGEGAFDTWLLRYGRVHNAQMRIHRVARESPATPFRRSGAEDVAYMASLRRDLEPRAGTEVRRVLDSAHDVVTIAMTARAAQRMAWPVGVAAAAWLAARGDGLLHAPGSGWLAPTPKEVRPVR